MNEAKFTPAEALQTATINPAKFLGKANEFGKIERGFVADLVLLEANPLEDIKNIRRVNTVILRGKILNRDSLNGLLQEVERK
ncbi:MAG: amidohydrolase family protein [Pyrinomonadaceae bacterium]